MGIKQLFSIIKDEAPAAIKEGDIKNQFGRKVAIVSFILPFLISSSYESNMSTYLPFNSRFHADSLTFSQDAYDSLPPSHPSSSSFARSRP